MYDKSPYIPVSDSSSDCLSGWHAIARQVRDELPPGRSTVCVECYPGVFTQDVCEALAAELKATRVVRAEECLLASPEIERKFHATLTDDPVFGILSEASLAEFFDPAKLDAARTALAQVHDGLTLVVGTGAALLAETCDLLLYADLARWEIQQRQRRGEIGNLGLENQKQRASLKYKRAFFLDWRAADRFKLELFARINFFLDTHRPATPKMVAARLVRRGLQQATAQPFRVVPFFDPGPWGGHWMEEVCDLPRDQPNYAWCFDCVPEENSLLLGFGSERVEIPAIDLVLTHPQELLGTQVYRRFGAEFPIRFDFLDTFDGGNLSLQVHPLTGYIREKFGMDYTQDESYYMLDAREDATVYLGFREGIDREAALRELRGVESGETEEFDVERYVNKFPARKHDHFLIPAGTIHCSGRNSMVLEISATPYIFTFKLWDWGRLGLDGYPRPIHLNHGAANLQWDRTTDWVRSELVNRVEMMAEGPGWREERTGLHALEFIETRRHWFTVPVAHDTQGTVNVLNLVEGSEIVVESPSTAFAPFVVHYAETFIVPAAVGPYWIRPAHAGEPCATVKAFVRPTD